MFKSLTVNYDDQVTEGSGDIWLRLEQEYKPATEDKAKLSDLSQMLALARGGTSPYSFISDTCGYAKVEGDVVFVTLDFYVWVSSLDVPYSLKSDIGDISTAEPLEEHRSFDVVFNGSAEADLPYIFDGTIVPEMPFISSSGDILDGVEITINEGTAGLSSPAYCVLRAEGEVIGYKHSIEMELIKALAEGEEGEHTGTSFKTVNWVEAGGGYNQGAYPVVHNSGAIEEEWTLRFTTDTNFSLYNANNNRVATGNINQDFVTDYFTLRAAGWRPIWEQNDQLRFRVEVTDGIDHTGYKITNLQNTIVASYTDAEGEPKEEVMELDIPPCVEDLLEACDDGTVIAWIDCLRRDCDDKDPYYVVKVNGCDGHIISQGWVSNA